MPPDPPFPPPPAPGGPPDKALGGLALAGEARAFGERCERHADRVFRYLRFRLWDPAVATDLTQDVFVNALHHRGTLRRPERFASWLMQIAHNRLVNHRAR